LRFGLCSQRFTLDHGLGALTTIVVSLTSGSCRRTLDHGLGALTIIVISHDRLRLRCKQRSSPSSHQQPSLLIISQPRLLSQVLHNTSQLSICRRCCTSHCSPDLVAGDTLQLGVVLNPESTSLFITLCRHQRHRGHISSLQLVVISRPRQSSQAPLTDYLVGALLNCLFSPVSFIWFLQIEKGLRLSIRCRRCTSTHSSDIVSCAARRLGVVISTESASLYILRCHYQRYRVGICLSS